VRLLSACEPAPTRSDVAEPMHATAAESTAQCIVHDPTAEMRAAAAEEAEEDARVERALDRVMLLLDRRYAVPPSPEAPPEGTTLAPRAPALRNAGKSMCCTLEHSSPCAVRLSTRVPLDCARRCSRASVADRSAESTPRCDSETETDDDGAPWPRDGGRSGGGSAEVDSDFESEASECFRQARAAMLSAARRA
jgi:hypothetical protein